MDDVARHFGIADATYDLAGHEHRTSPDTVRALLHAMGHDEASARAAMEAENAEERVLPRTLVHEASTPLDVEEEWRLTLEDGTTRQGRGPVADVPLGRHCIEIGDARTTVLSAPASLPLPDRAWGMTLPLHALAPTRGYGTYADLAAAARSLDGTGCAFLGINPIHAGFPANPDAYSPYSPSHRRRLDIRYVQGTDDGEPSDLIDYRTDTPRRLLALRDSFRPDGAFREWRTSQGSPLERFATHQALSESLGPYWSEWPEEFREPGTAAVRAFASENADAVSFHAWAQWRAHVELLAAADAAGAMHHGLYLDLAVGTHPHGAETWDDRISFARDVSLGAPPDAFSPDGQTWGLAPFDPRALARTGFASFAETLRAQLTYARMLRIDHILGFERAWWVPRGEWAGASGAYVAMPRDELLAVTRIEAARAHAGQGAVIVGEDLGNIPPGLQGALAASGVLGCRVVQFESEGGHARPAHDYPEQVLASFATHDLPTWRGWREGRDITWREKIGDIDTDRGSEARWHRGEDVGALDRLLDGRDVHALLAETPSRLVAVQAEDALGLLEQPNLPGTTTEHPNWRRRLGIEPGDLGKREGVRRIAQIMRNADR